LKSRYFYGYNIVAAGFITQAVVIGAMFTYGVFFKELEAAFGWSRTLVSGASSAAFLCMGIGGVLAGSLNDRFGPRSILTFSSISLGLGYIMMSQMGAAWQLYLLYGLLVGIGFATHDVITLSTVARWFIRRRGMMTGLVKVGTGGGQLVVPLLAAAMIARLGWRPAYLVIGILSLVALIAVAQMMRRDPQGMDLLPDGDPPKASVAGQPTPAPSLTLAAAARTLTFWSLCIAEFMIFGCLLTTIVHIVPHARDLGLQPTTAAAVLSTIGGISMLGRMVMGMAIDRIGGKRSLVLSLTLLIFSLIWVQVSTSAWMLFFFAVLYGFAHGALFTVMSPTVAEFFGTASHGLIFGMVLFCGTLGGSLGPLIAGYIFDLSGAYRAAFITLTIMACSGLVLAVLIRPVETDAGTTGG